jgi:hypothetical protein
MSSRSSRRRVLRHAAGAAALGLAAAPAAHASESGASFYLLGTGGPEAAVLPPIQGVFLGNTVFYYHGEAGGSRRLILNGNVVAGVRGTIVADFPGVIWVPSTNFLNGTLALGGLLPFGDVSANASVVLTGPRGRRFGVSADDNAFVLGDPVLTASLGWKRGNTYAAFSDLLNVPIGQYRKDQLANLAFHRWANDISFAVSWHEPQSGWDLSAKTGFTLNGRNDVTDYTTGTEWHLEAAAEKQLTPAWALGVQAYHFGQVTGDTGSGAKLGAFKGRVTGVGGEAAYNFKLMGKVPVTLRLHGTTEFDVQNRLQGHSIWLDLAMPLHVRMPPGAMARQ